jgi:hypothetical protein
VGRAFVDRGGELTLAIGYEVIWRSKRGWVTYKARGMLLGKRSMGGSRRNVPSARAVNFVSNKLKEAVMLTRQQEQEEKKALAGSNTATTYFAKAQNELTLQDQAGRFSADVMVTGSRPIQTWPSLPEGNPWAEPADLPGVEPPTGIDINAQEPCGEAWEQEQDIQVQLARASLVSSSTGDAASELVAPLAADAGAISPSTDRGVAPSFKLRRL